MLQERLRPAWRERNGHASLGSEAWSPVFVSLWLVKSCDEHRKRGADNRSFHSSTERNP